ncbi:DUF5694 domain-containing protein [Parvularcula maris]|uniref:DUF5694 domain-containing protein n=1 Tax=Parvularcula maris TaxID=2965077 RepID=A0A9X2L788_9PROT|nr:DUF5694 domain-containing protein [Parvularcula maris]MCQ8184373.1 DUF5694 domain-containing protein [Parvularcula maris]
MRHFFLSLFAVLAAACSTTPGTDELTKRDEETVRVMVLGSYHFANPGRDLNNVEADNVFSPVRQRELEQLAKALSSFGPTVVAVEGTAEPPYDDPIFDAFDDAMLQSDPDEAVQIGYRLASEAGTYRVYAIDEFPSAEEQVHLPYGYFPFPPLSSFAEETGRTEDLERITDLSAFTRNFEEAQSTMTIPELLLLYNDGEGSERLDDFYWNVTTFGEGENQPGPELAAFWFLRNAKIFNKMVQVTRPGDRVVIVYGAGHGAWLRELVEKTDGYELEPVAPYLRRAAHELEGMSR